MISNLVYLIQMKKIHKALNKYIERKYNKYRYGYAFIEKEVLRDHEGEYLLYDPDDDQFVEEAIAYIDMDRGKPKYDREYFVMHWVRKIRLERI